MKHLILLCALGLLCLLSLQTQAQKSKTAKSDSSKTMLEHQAKATMDKLIEDLRQASIKLEEDAKQVHEHAKVMAHQANDKLKEEAKPDSKTNLELQRLKADLEKASKEIQNALDSLIKKTE